MEGSWAQGCASLIGEGILLTATGRLEREDDGQLRILQTAQRSSGHRC